MAFHRTCDGVVRRDFLKLGALGAGGLSLSNYLRWTHAASARPKGAKAAIFIKTSVPGIQISEHLPKLAQCMDKYVILRGITHSLAAHKLGQEYVNTGNRPIPSLEFPGYGAVVSRELGGPMELPHNVAIPKNNQGGTGQARHQRLASLLVFVA